MSTYIVEIRGDTSFTDYQSMVKAEENSGARFVKNNVSFHENAMNNLLTFEDLPPGQRPAKPLVFSVGNPPASESFTPVWAGVILCDGRNLGVSAYR